MADVSSIKYSSSASVNVKYAKGRADIKDIQMYIGMDDPHMTGIYADFTNNIFRRIGGGALLQPGSDFDIYNMYGKRGRCTVDDFGNITSRYGDQNYVEDGSMGQVMVYQPKFYYKVVPMKTSTDNLGNTVLDCGIYYISDEKLDGFKCHPAFIDDAGSETDGYFIGAFDSTFYDVSESEYRLYDTWEVEHTEGTTTYRVVALDAYPADADTDILASIAGAKPVTEKRSPEFTRTGAQRMANRRGSKWGIMDLKIYSAEQLLFAVEYGTFNAQNEIGMGSVSMDLSPENISIFSGSTVGNTTGQADTSYTLGSNGIYSTYRISNYPNRVAVNYRGAENLWGNTRKLINGITIYGNNNNQAGKVYICSDHNFVEDKITDNYEDTGFTLPYSTTYISRFGYDANYDWAFIPVGATGANSNLPVGDTFESESDHLNGYDKLSVGGYNRAGYGAGMFSWCTRYRANDTDQYTSARLVRYDSTPEQVLGLHADFENNTFTRLAGASGKSAGSDFDDYNMYENRKVCAVQDDGTISKWFGDTGYVEDGSIGQIMVRQPKFYYKVVPVKLEAIEPDDETQTDAKGYHLLAADYYISDTELPGFKLHPAFINADGNEADCYYIGSYEASVYDVSASEYRVFDRWIATDNGDGTYTVSTTSLYGNDYEHDLICSVTDVKPAEVSAHNNTLYRYELEKMANNRNRGWGNINAKMLAAEQLLMVIEYAAFNVQNAIGKGVVDYDNSNYNDSAFTGSTSSLGNTTGSAVSSRRAAFVDGTRAYDVYTEDGYKSVRYRGVENLWGNSMNLICGVNIWGNGKMNGGEVYICNNTRYVEDKKDDNYEGIGFTSCYVNGEYTKYFGYSETHDWIFMPSKGGGTSDLPIGDRIYTTEKLDGYKYPANGGSFYHGLNSGCFFQYNGLASSQLASGSAGRLTYIPPTYEIGDVIDLSESSYTLQEKDLTAVGFRIYGNENGVGTMFDDVRAVLSVSPGPSTTPAFNASTYKIGEILYEGDYVDVFVYYEDAYSGSREGSIATALAACTTSTVFSGGSQAMYIKKFSFLYPKS